jgi:hypothetical protein
MVEDFGPWGGHDEFENRTVKLYAIHPEMTSPDTSRSKPDGSLYVVPGFLTSRSDYAMYLGIDGGQFWHLENAGRLSPVHDESRQRAAHQLNCASQNLKAKKNPRKSRVIALMGRLGSLPVNRTERRASISCSSRSVVIGPRVQTKIIQITLREGRIYTTRFGYFNYIGSIFRLSHFSWSD